MGDHPRVWSAEFFAGRRRARRSSARSSRSATRSSRSSRSRARRRANSTHMRRAFDSAVRGQRAGVPADLQFKHSFRSGPNRARRRRQGVQAAGRHSAARPPTRCRPVHECAARRGARPGRNLGHRSSPTAKHEIEGWDAPFDDRRETSPRVRLAPDRRDRAANRARRPRRRRDGAPMRRRRAGAGAPARRRCSRRSSARSRMPACPVAGADRLVLTEHIAVMDLMVLADALLLPDDDLALATVLKSPLFGLDDERPVRRSPGSARHRCARRLRAKAPSDRASRRPPARLDRLARCGAQRDAVRLLCPRARRRSAGASAFLARLGPEADDALDEFLNLALDYERRETPSLQGFVAWLRAARPRSSATWRSPATRCG